MVKFDNNILILLLKKGYIMEQTMFMFDLKKHRPNFKNNYKIKLIQEKNIKKHLSFAKTNEQDTLP